MNCQEFQDKLAESLDGMLELVLQQAMDAHRQSCAECRKEYEMSVRMHQQLQGSAKEYTDCNLDEEVMNRIFCEQQYQIRRLTMLRRYKKLGWAATIAAVFMIVLFFSWPTQRGMTASAAEILAQAVDAMNVVPGLKSLTIYMQARMRTRPGENFSYINLNCDFVPMEMWLRANKNELGQWQGQWRVENPGRVLLMDGQNTTMLIRPNHGVRVGYPQKPGDCFDCWMGRLLNVRELLDDELRQTKNNPRREASLRHEQIDGRDKIILDIEETTGTPEKDYLRNAFISDSDHRKEYCFDAETKFLESLRIFVHSQNEDVLIFEITSIEYNSEIADDVFVLTLPENMVWHKDPEKLPDNERYANMTPKEMAEAFFQACGDENWDEFLKFWTSSRIDERIKKHLGGLKINSLGEPFQSGGYGGWFVPYEIQLKDGSIKKHNLAVRNDNPAKRYVVDGGI